MNRILDTWFSVVRRRRKAGTITVAQLKDLLRPYNLQGKHIAFALIELNAKPPKTTTSDGTELLWAEIQREKMYKAGYTNPILFIWS